MHTPPSPARERVGVFGGAFDPPHQGHMALARTAVAQLQLNVLHIIPTGQAWHKTRTLTDASHRMAMAQLAFADVPHAVVDAREIQRSGPTYTVDTLKSLQAEYPHAQMYLILGLDQAQALKTWRRWEEILQLAIICVAGRADCAGSVGTLDALIPVFSGLQVLKMPPVAISATDIRSRLAHHENVAPLVFEPVARYIDNHHLYQAAR